jgi:tetratricopeptide (TPR) repeat protein
MALHNLGLYASQGGRWDEATRLYTEALAIERELGNRRREPTYLISIGFVDLQQGWHAEARPRFEEALAIARDAGLHDSAALALGDLALVDLEEGRLEVAGQRLTEALAHFASVDERRYRGCFLGWLGAVRAAAGDVEGARAAVDEGAKLLDAVGDHLAAGGVEVLRGFVDLTEGHPERALARIAKAKEGDAPPASRSDYARLAVRMLEKRLG